MNKEEFKKKVKEVAKETGIDEDKIVDHIDILVNLIKVRSRLGGNVTEDYVLAYFGEAERDFIRENFENAEYAKNIIKRYGEKGYVYEWNEEKNDWEKNEDGSYKKIDVDEKLVRDKLFEMGMKIFEFFMIQPHLIAILHRNKDKNFMVKLLGKGDEEKEQIVGQMDEKSFMGRIKDAVRGGVLKKMVIETETKKVRQGEAQERIFLGDKNWGFRAILSNDGRYRFDIDTKGCNLAQLGILTLLHQKIGDEIKNCVKETAIRDNDKFTSREDEDIDGIK